MRGDAGSGAREQMRRDAGNEVRGSKSRQRETRVDPACESHTHAHTQASELLMLRRGFRKSILPTTAAQLRLHTRREWKREEWVKRSNSDSETNGFAITFSLSLQSSLARLLTREQQPSMHSETPASQHQHAFEQRRREPASAAKRASL